MFILVQTCLFMVHLFCELFEDSSNSPESWTVAHRNPERAYTVSFTLTVRVTGVFQPGHLNLF